jgi:hypothetical protein
MLDGIQIPEPGGRKPWAGMDGTVGCPKQNPTEPRAHALGYRITPSGLPIGMPDGIQIPEPGGRKYLAVGGNPGSSGASMGSYGASNGIL